MDESFELSAAEESFVAAESLDADESFVANEPFAVDVSFAADEPVIGNESFVADVSFAADDQVVETESRHSCDKCSFVSRYMSSLRRHVRQRHCEIKATDKPDLHPYVCDQCGKKFKTKTGHKNHDESVHKLTFKHTCSVCQ